ncbi:M23 family metallopeptidase [Sphingomonas hylomeconis]|uniref:M23 family metallopeptidase n=1 Tax=Sphingomonas hylomeconis TaxID=1395958 RepID=A0ABV7SXL1_9SPHN|nr:M23 family metallopeptidase [Sphingomonas hylomeconis]
MTKISTARVADKVARVRTWFVTRDFIFHDGRALRRFSIAGRTQAVAASAAAVVMCFSAYGVAQAAVGAASLTGIVEAPLSPETKIEQMQAKVAAMQADVAKIRTVAQAHAARVEQRQALISAVVTGKGDAAAITAAAAPIDAQDTKLAASVIAPLQKIERRQVALAVQARLIGEQRLAMTVKHVRGLGIAPSRVAARVPAMGGPFEAADAATTTTEAQADLQFRSLFMTWKKLDSLEQGVIAIPSVQPVEHMSFTSNFGVRSDPFRGTAAMHAGVDIPGPVGTPIYATADGTIGRAERSGGYGNLVEINHGKGIQTRYGHLSKILVAPMARVKRGQLIALMGSTGRSTGPHLHYEVRIDGHAVSPVPFLQTADYLAGVQDRAARMTPVAIGGPAPATD